MSSSPNEKKSNGFVKNTNFILSEINTDKTFKNVLRGGDGEHVYKEHRMIYFREQESKKKDDKSVFDDTYQQAADNEVKNKNKFENNYVKGNLKSNIIFDDKFKTNKIERWTHNRTQKEIEKKNPTTKKPETTDYVEVITPSLLRKVNDNFKKNPIDILSKNQNEKLSTQQKEKTLTKFNRVSDYLGSEGFKSTINFYKEDNLIASDKITNKNFNLRSSYEIQPKKAFRHLHGNGQVFYG